MEATSVGLRRIDSLTVTFLVDNCIEWMTKFPPGFTLETAQHLRYHDPTVDERTGVPVVDLENYCCGAHGFSALIQTEADGSTNSVLMDTGPDSRSIIRNIESMRTEVRDIKRIVISHWHSDHSGGLLSFLRYRNSKIEADNDEFNEKTSLVVDVHPDRPIARGIAQAPEYEKVVARLPEDPSFDSIQEAGAIVETNDIGHLVANGTVYVSGEIPRVTSFENGLLSGVRWVEKDGEGKWIKEEQIMDERYVLVDIIGKGLVIFSACSHAGIVNVVKDAITKFQRPVYMIIGGLHLAGPELAYRIPPTTEFLSQKLRPACTYVLPMHCSGFAAKTALREALGDGCVPAGVGITINLKSDAEAEKILFAPVMAE